MTVLLNPSDVAVDEMLRHVRGVLPPDIPPDRIREACDRGEKEGGCDGCDHDAKSDSRHHGDHP